MDGLNISKIFEIKPISDVDSKKEYIKKKRKKEKEKMPIPNKSEEKNEKGNIVDIYV